MGSAAIGPLRIGDGSGWTFFNGVWQDDPDGGLCPPDGTQVEYLAVREHEVYGDCTASFRFRLRNITPVRFLFRLQDSRRFYALDIPFGGQQFRSRACWAGLVIADGTPLQRYLNGCDRHIMLLLCGQWESISIDFRPKLIPPSRCIGKGS